MEKDSNKQNGTFISSLSVGSRTASPYDACFCKHLMLHITNLLLCYLIHFVFLFCTESRFSIINILKGENSASMIMSEMELQNQSRTKFTKNLRNRHKGNISEISHHPSLTTPRPHVIERPAL